MALDQRAMAPREAAPLTSTCSRAYPHPPMCPHALWAALFRRGMNPQAFPTPGGFALAFQPELLRGNVRCRLLPAEYAAGSMIGQRQSYVLLFDLDSKATRTAPTAVISATKIAPLPPPPPPGAAKASEKVTSNSKSAKEITQRVFLTMIRP
jgi:hypothetical protein